MMQEKQVLSLLLPGPVAALHGTLFLVNHALHGPTYGVAKESAILGVRAHSVYDLSSFFYEERIYFLIY